MARKTSSKATSTRKTSTPESEKPPGESPGQSQKGADAAARPEGGGAPERPSTDAATGTAQPDPDATRAQEGGALPDDAGDNTEDDAQANGTDTGAPGPEGTDEGPPSFAGTSVDRKAGAVRDDATEREADAHPQDTDHADHTAPGTAPDDTAQHSGPDPTTPAPAVTEQVTVRKGGFVPMMLGGILAGAIGFGAAYYLMSQRAAETTAAIETLRSEMQQALQEQSGRISALSDAVDAAEPPDLSGLRMAQSDLQETVTALSGRLDGLQETLGATRDRLTALEKRPIAEGASDAAIAAYEAELKALQDAMARQRAEVERMIAEARQMEEDARATAQATRRRAALSRIETALDTGRAYADAVAELESTGIEVPEGLSRRGSDGVATQAELEQSFPAAARKALAAARQAAIEAGKAGGLVDFLRTELGVRSLEPRPGNDPDAILSRAEAALREGRLRDALDEIGTLPDVARTELSDWTARATRRLDALAAVQELSEKLN